MPRLLLQEHLRESFRQAHEPEKGASMSAPLVDVTQQHKELTQARKACEEVRRDLFESCCEFQRDPNSVPLDRLATLTSNLKTLERQHARLEEEFVKALLATRG